jgi:hypothetical protein
MNALIVTTGQAAALAALNASGDPGRQLQPAAATDGRLALNPDLLADCGPGQTWEHYAAFLASLAADAVIFAETNVPD